MKQMMVSQNKSSLLNHAISTLSPEVFSHPVWMRFGQKEGSASRTIVDDLLNTVKNLQNDDPGAACQVLLICAVYQNYAGQHFNALKTIQQAIALAQENSLSKETIWAIWGACALTMQQENYEKAFENLVDLQAVLSEHNEWMLADFVDVLRPALSEPAILNRAKHSNSSSDDAFEDILTFTFNWFQHWGFSTQAYQTEFELKSTYSVNPRTNQSALTHSFFSIQHWQGQWHTLMLAIRGELRLQWREASASQGKSRFSFWGSMLGFLGVHPSDRNSAAPAIDDASPLVNPSLLPSVEESPAPTSTAHEKEQKIKAAKGNSTQPSDHETPTTPVAVHMLGAFSLAIGESTVKLPASRGLSLLKYLLLHHKQSISRDVLMDTFWPEAEPDLARNNLNVAMHNLRKVLFNVTDLPLIIYENGLYSLAPNLQLWLDIEEFERCVKAGKRLEALNQLTAAVAEYEAAISLYQGDFLEQNPYEEWTILEREQLRMAYLDTLDRLSQIYFRQEQYAACITVCQLILISDRCREDAHCLMIRCYSRQGQRHLALRQFQVCLEALRAELNVEPDPTTIQLVERIYRHEQV